MAEALREFAMWYSEIFMTPGGSIAFVIAAFTVSLWITCIKMMRDNKKAMSEEKKRKEELDKFN